MKKVLLDRANQANTPWQKWQRIQQPLQITPTERKSGISIVLKASIAFLLSLVAWELILRNTMEQSPGSTNHPILGKITKPGVVVSGGEGFSRSTINSLGMRDAEIAPKAKGEFRVLSLGDSFTSGEHIEETKTYTALAEAGLKRDSKSPTNVVNGGRPGASPAYYLHLADFYNSKIQPDSVIVQFNDSDFTGDALDSSKEFYIAPQGNAFKTVRNQNFSSDDRLSQLLQEKLPQLSFLTKVSIVRIGGRNLQSMLRGNPAIANEETTQPDTKNYDDLIEWTVVNLKAKYRNLVIVHIPYVTFNNPKEPPNPVEASLAKIAAKHNVAFVGMRQDFVDYYREFHQPASGFNNTTPGTGHTNEIGNELIAKRLIPILETMRRNTNP